MKKLLTIMVLALALCLVCGAALADEAVYNAADITPGAVVNGHTIIANDYATQALTHTGHAEIGDVRLYYVGGGGETLNFTVKVVFNPHVWVDQYDVPATCFENGYTVQQCSICYATRNSYYKGLLKTNHIGTTEVRTFKDPTCGEEGVAKTFCTKCGQWIDGTEHPIEKIKTHQYEDAPVEMPTCLQLADPTYQYRVYWNCKFCGANYEETELGSKKIEHVITKTDFFNRFALTGWYTGHVWSDWADVLTKEGKANCIQGQQQERYCSVCKSVDKRTKPGSYPLEPDWVIDTKKLSETLTCATDKSKVFFICQRCAGKVAGHGSTAATFLVKDNMTYACSPKLSDNTFVSVPMNHEYKLTSTYLHKLANGDTWIKGATCTTGSYKEYYCVHDTAKVGDPTHATYHVEVAPANGHSFGDWTLQSAEHWIRKCKNCSKYENHFGKLPPAENCTTHTPVEDVENSKAATCTEKGLTAYKCSVCGTALEGKEIPALGHDWDETIKKAATCKEEGLINRICKRCNLAEANVKVEKLPHTWDEGKITKEATKEADGEKTFTCTVCGETKTEAVKWEPAKDPKYTMTASYNGTAVTGKLVHDDSTVEAAAKFVRVTFYVEGNYYMATMAEVEADGTFSVDGVGPIVYITAVATGNSSVNPEDVKVIAPAVEIFVK